jgi:RimJ/RimL family protein N-acetyltransferase
MEVIIRKVTPDDAKGVTSVINSVILEGRWTALTNTFTEEQERAFIEGLCERSAMFAAEVDDKIVGIQVIEPDGLARYTDSMQHIATIGTWIDANFRGHKIGRSLAEASFTFAKAHNYEKISIQVIADNTRALRFYGNLGFEEIGVAKKHVKFEDRFCDVFYLEKFLTDDS